ncbi:MAG: hypothetical protein VX642_05830 [Bdellovibrionota bacterium]|nr:hypothetical protein [Bdellovibrionota bacterium]
MSTGLNINNTTLSEASKVLEGLEADAEQQATGAAIESPLTMNKNQSSSSVKIDPLISKIVLERENKKKVLSEAASASQQVQFMEWLGEAEEDETNALLQGEDVEGLSFYDEVHKMMEIWVQLNWLETPQGKKLARQACILGADLPLFPIDELKKL